MGGNEGGGGGPLSEEFFLFFWDHKGKRRLSKLAAGEIDTIIRTQVWGPPSRGPPQRNLMVFKHCNNQRLDPEKADFFLSHINVLCT